MNENEMVFCLKLADLQTLFGGPLPQGGVSNPDFDRLLELPQHFIPRRIAENDEGYKQIIPYQVFGCGREFFVFRRGGGVGEQRLSGRLSLGIGGHVNDGDADNGRMTGAAFNAALLRERHEELRLSGPVTTCFAGTINDDSDAVGRVHLGAVFLCRVERQEDISLGDDEDLHFEGWWTVEEIRAERERFEKWSILAVEQVRQDRRNSDRVISPI